MGLPTLYLSNLRSGSTRACTKGMLRTNLRWRNLGSLWHWWIRQWKSHGRMLKNTWSVHNSYLRNFLCHPFLSIVTFPIMTHLAFSKDFEFLPQHSTVCSSITPFFDNFYPPPILVKHHTWYLHNADLFISVRGTLYGIHQWRVEDSILFQEILRYGQGHLIGIILIHPISFDDLKKEIFNHLLILLYCGTTILNHLTKNDWVDVKWLCINWYLPHQTSMIIQRLCEIQIQQLLPQNQYFSETFTFQHINRRHHQIWRYHRNVINESAPEDMVIVEDDWSLDGG
jgi:hypothetical protein